MSRTFLLNLVRTRLLDSSEPLDRPAVLLGLQPHLIPDWFEDLVRKQFEQNTLLVFVLPNIPSIIVFESIFGDMEHADNARTDRWYQCLYRTETPSACLIWGSIQARLKAFVSSMVGTHVATESITPPSSSHTLQVQDARQALMCYVSQVPAAWEIIWATTLSMPGGNVPRSACLDFLLPGIDTYSPDVAFMNHVRAGYPTAITELVDRIRATTPSTVISDKDALSYVYWLHNIYDGAAAIADTTRYTDETDFEFMLRVRDQDLSNRRRQNNASAKP